MKSAARVNFLTSGDDRAIYLCGITIMQMRNEITTRLLFIGLPLCTSSNNRGMATSVSVLRKVGIVEQLKRDSVSLVDLGDVPLSQLHSDSGSKNLKNFEQFLQDTQRIRSAVSRANADGLLFALGGECSICVGALAGLKDSVRGEPGIVWINAHGDFNTPDTTPSGYIGGMCLAMACGRGPALNKTIGDAGPSLKDENIVHVASRSLDPAESISMSSSRMKIYPASTLRTEGITPILNLALKSLADRCDWIICHLDIDSIDPKTMPAVNFPERDGLNLEEIKGIVGAVKRTGKLKLFELAGYNPDLDRNRMCATKLVTLMVDILAQSRLTSDG